VTMDQDLSLLVVDDDPALARFLTLELECEGYVVRQAHDGIQALTMIREQCPSLVLMDWGLPDMDGLSVCRRLRETGVRVPVIMLTGRDEVTDRVQALDAGADDYLIKPFALEELLARCRALLRRTAVEPPVTEGLIHIGDLVIDPRSRDVSRGGVPISLAAREYDLLLFLARQAGRVVARGEILENVWGPNFFGDGNVLDVYIRYLRQKIEQPERPQLIHTYRGVGYMLRASDDA